MGDYIPRPDDENIREIFVIEESPADIWKLSIVVPLSVIGR